MFEYQYPQQVLFQQLFPPTESYDYHYQQQQQYQPQYQLQINPQYQQQYQQVPQQFYQPQQYYQQAQLSSSQQSQLQQLLQQQPQYYSQQPQPQQQQPQPQQQPQQHQQQHQPPQPQQVPQPPSLHYIPQLYQSSKRSPLIEKLADVLPHPPLSLATISFESFTQNPPKRLRRRSKYTKEQDEMIVKLKKLGRSWVAIADITGVGSFLAARNRYQVLIGQQGGGTSECDIEDIMALQSLIDDGEIEKWRFLSREFHKSTGKKFTDRELQDIVRLLFWSNPESFGISEDYLKLFMKLKETNTTKTNESHNHNNHSPTNSSILSTELKSPYDQPVDNTYTEPTTNSSASSQHRYQEEYYPSSYHYTQ